MDFLTRFFEALFVRHPLHTIFVHFPIALTAAALLFVVLARWRRSRPLEQVAFFNTALAAAGTIFAAITGMWDNTTRFDGVAPNANVKIFLGVSLFLLTTVTAVARWRRPEVLWQPKTTVLYIAAHAGSFLMAATLGFLGSVILYGF